MGFFPNVSRPVICKGKCVRCYQSRRIRCEFGAEIVMLSDGDVVVVDWSLRSLRMGGADRIPDHRFHICLV